MYVASVADGTIGRWSLLRFNSKLDVKRLDDTRSEVRLSLRALTLICLTAVRDGEFLTN